MNRKVALVAAVLSGFLLSGCGESPAELTLANAKKIATTNVFGAKGMVEFERSLASCNNDRFCLSRTTYEVYESAFKEAGFSQIETAFDYKKLVDKTKDQIPSRDSQILMRNWGDAMMGVYMCISDKPCKQWMIETDRIAESDIAKLML